ncbi:MAG: YbaY family lipoprotein [Gammaproteobacteria bacterium]
MKPVPIIFLTSLVLAGCAGDDEDAGRTRGVAAGPGPITGTLDYRERITLSPSSRVEIRLLDVSAPDAPATTLGIARIDDPGLPPIDFRLHFNPANIAERNAYVVRAEIRDGDRLIFTTGQAQPVLTRGGGNTVNLTLVAVDHTPTPAAPLHDTHWKLIAIDSQPVANKPPPDDTHLVLTAEENRAVGNCGCNRYSASFVRDGERLSFGSLEMTATACIDSAGLEHDFMKALERVDRFEIAERELRLYAGARSALTFVAIEE